MGVSTNVYGYFGIRLEWNDKLNDAFEAYWEENNEADLPDYVFDSMTGEYQVLGIQLFDSGDFRYGAEDGDGFTRIDMVTLAEQEQEYKEKFRAQFPQLADLMQQPFEILMFTHWS